MFCCGENCLDYLKTNQFVILKMFMTIVNVHYFLTQRENDAGFDLNRNFPDYFETNQYTIQPETRAIMKWIEENQFVLSANLHGGALVANYGFDNIYPGGFCSNTEIVVSCKVITEHFC